MRYPVGAAIKMKNVKLISQNFIKQNLPKVGCAEIAISTFA